MKRFSLTRVAAVAALVVASSAAFAESRPIYDDDVFGITNLEYLSSATSQGQVGSVLPISGNYRNQDATSYRPNGPTTLPTARLGSDVCTSTNRSPCGDITNVYNTYNYQAAAAAPVNTPVATNNTTPVGGSIYCDGCGGNSNTGLGGGGYTQNSDGSYQAPVAQAPTQTPWWAIEDTPAPVNNMFPLGGSTVAQLFPPQIPVDPPVVSGGGSPPPVEIPFENQFVVDTGLVNQTPPTLGDPPVFNQIPTLITGYTPPPGGGGNEFGNGETGGGGTNNGGVTNGADALNGSDVMSDAFGAAGGFGTGGFFGGGGHEGSDGAGNGAGAGGGGSGSGADAASGTGTDAGSTGGTGD